MILFLFLLSGRQKRASRTRHINCKDRDGQKQQQSPSGKNECDLYNSSEIYQIMNIFQQPRPRYVLTAIDQVAAVGICRTGRNMEKVVRQGVYGKKDWPEKVVEAGSSEEEVNGVA